MGRRPVFWPVQAKPGKPMKGVDYIGLDATRTQLCFSSGVHWRSRITVPFHLRGQPTVARILWRDCQAGLKRSPLSASEPTGEGIKDMLKISRSILRQSGNVRVESGTILTRTAADPPILTALTAVKIADCLLT